MIFFSDALDLSINVANLPRLVTVEFQAKKFVKRHRNIVVAMRIVRMNRENSSNDAKVLFS